jgi:transcriptional regulator with XRE-family HTH domain
MSQSQIPRVLDALKNLLRSHGLRYSDVAGKLGVGERTIKRYLSGENLTIEILEQMCALVEIELSELTELAIRDLDRKPNTLSTDQEQALSQDLFAAFVFRLLRYGWTSQEIQNEFELDEADLVKRLLFLDHLGLIDLLPNNRLRLRTARVIEWKPGGPVRQAFDTAIKQGFVEMDYRKPSAVWDLKTVKLSRSSFDKLRRLIAEFATAVMHLGEDDRRLSQEQATWFAVLSAVRPVDPKLLRDSPPKL